MDDKLLNCYLGIMTVFLPCLTLKNRESQETRYIYLIFSFKESFAIFPRDSNQHYLISD